MQKIILYCFILLWQNASAKDVAGVLNSADVKVEPQSTCNGTCESEKNFSQCLTDICGPAKSTKNHQDMVKDLEIAVMDSKATSLPLKKTIEDYYKTKLAYAESSLKDINKLLSEDKVAIDPEYVKLHKFNEMLTTINKLDWNIVLASNVIIDNRLEMTCDSKKLKDELQSLYGSSKGARLTATIHELVKNKNFQKIFFGMGYGWALSLEHEYPGHRLSEIIAKQKVEQEKILNALKTSSPKTFEILSSSINLKPELLAQIQNDPNPSEDMLNDYFSLFSTLNLANDYLLNSPPEFSKFKPTTLYDFLPKKEIQQFVDKRINEAASLDINSSVIQKNIHHCEAINNKIQAGLPSSLEREQFIKLVATYRENFKSKLTSKLSEESAKILNEKIDLVKFDIPSDRNFKTELLINDLREKKEDLSKDDLFKSKSQDNKNNYLLIDLQDQLSSDFSDFTSDIAKDCDGFELGSLEDYSLQLGSGKIKISWLALKDPAIGKGIISHELSHALSSIIKANVISKHSGQVFKEARQCLNSGHFSMNNESVSHMVNKKATSDNYIVDHYVEENWADLGGAISLGKEDKNFACFLVDKNQAGSYESNLLYPETEDDTHSTDLYRVLKVQTAKNKELPASCLNLLSAQEKHHLTKQCLK